MPSINLYSRQTSSNDSAIQSTLPGILQTPSGLAILEIQGTLNVPMPEVSQESSDTANAQPTQTLVGRLVFPLHNANALDIDSTAWMKLVYLYVGQHQRLTGEVKKLPKPIAVLRKRNPGDTSCEGSMEDELEIAEIVKHKIVFASRPEPVGD